MCVWDKKTGTVVGVPMESHAPVIALIFSSRGQIISGSADGVVNIWNHLTSTPTAQYKCEGGVMVSLVLSHNGSWCKMVNWLFTLGFPVQTNTNRSFLVVLRCVCGQMVKKTEVTIVVWQGC